MNPADEAHMRAWGIRHRKDTAERLAREAQELRERVERFKALSPQEKLFARMDAFMARRERPRIPAIDPEGDVDRPGETGWHGRKW